MSDKKNVFEKLKDLIKGNMTPEELDALKNYKPINIKMASAKTKDGKELSYEGELKVGTPLMTTGVDGAPIPAPDGSYEIEKDGTVVVVMGGMVTEIKPATAPPAPAELAQMQTQMSAQKTSFEIQMKKQNDRVENLEKQVALLTKFSEQILETPIVFEHKEKKEFDWSKATPLEKHLHSKNLIK